MMPLGKYWRAVSDENGGGTLEKPACRDVAS
jgi:hypothetical protein